LAIKKNKSEQIFNVFNIVILFAITMITLLPMLHVVMASFSDSTELVKSKGLVLFPKGFNLEAYKMVAANPSIYSGYRVTIITVVMGTLLSVAMTALGAYVLSRKNLMWYGFISKFIIFTMFFSGGMIPFYIVVNNILHLGDNILALILPALISTWNLMVMRTSFAAIPGSLIESAQIDGANDFVILIKIVIPASMAIIAVMVLFYGVSYWNSWFNAVLFIRKRSLYPLQLILREILIINSQEGMTGNVALADKNAVAESIKYATIVVATVPILLIYPYLQRYFVKGVMVGSVKG